MILITPPGVEPVTLQECKAELRHNVPDDDDLLNGLLAAARARLDGYEGILCRCLITQTWSMQIDRWDENIRLPFPDVSGVVVKYLDVNGVEQTVESTLHRLAPGSQGDWVWFTPDFTFPDVSDSDPAPITIEITAGFGSDAADVPAPLRQAIIMLVAHFFDAPAGQKLPVSVSAIIAPYRRIGI
ncbi:MAG: hypothetical protein AAF801_12825 [Pseudomonadota bacterium]